VERGLVEIEDGFLRLTAEGRLFSNDVFAEFLSDEPNFDLH
jgi:coproporphyrinogen III oxidase-like Fe-S oxidoreductase